MRVIWRAIVMLLALGATAPAWAGGMYVRDELRINMRAGPGLEYRIVKLLKSGDRVDQTETKEDWALVKAPEGEEGWVPIGYLQAEAPPSIALPGVQTRLKEARALVGDLEKRLGEQGNLALEAEALQLRVKTLEAKNARLTEASRWQELTAGGAIVLIGILIGALIPRGGRQRTRRVKL
jgi:SH3 domain protein